MKILKYLLMLVGFAIGIAVSVLYSDRRFLYLHDYTYALLAILVGFSIVLSFTSNKSAKKHI
jgi:hypothetical protein